MYKNREWVRVHFVNPDGTRILTVDQTTPGVRKKPRLPSDASVTVKPTLPEHLNEHT